MIMADNNNSNVTRRKLLGGMAIVGAASAGAGAGTYAYITDNETASFSFQSGSIILKISPKIVDFTEEAPTENNSEDNPQDDGDEMVTTITIENAGTLKARQLQLVGLTLEGPDDLKKAAEITTVEYEYPDGSTQDALSNWEGATDDFNSNGIIDLDDTKQKFDGNYPTNLLGAGNDLPPGLNGQFKLTLGVTYDYSKITTNGESLTASFEFSASQQN